MERWIWNDDRTVMFRLKDVNRFYISKLGNEYHAWAETTGHVYVVKRGTELECRIFVDSIFSKL